MHGHEVSDCYLLLPNGRYRREHWEEQPVVGKSIVNPAERFKTYVFEGQLTPPRSSLSRGSSTLLTSARSANRRS